MDDGPNRTKRSVAMDGVLTQRGVATPTQILRSIAAEFSRTERLVLMLSYTEELTVKEVAAVLELATSEVEGILARIRRHVRGRMKKPRG